MDIISHGLWGGAAFGTQRKRDFWPAFAFGAAPDFFAFALPFIFNIISVVSGGGGMFHSGKGMSEKDFPSYVFLLYSIGHSFVIFGIAFFAVWWYRKKAYVPMLSWGLHITMDLFTHSLTFFPTPFLWPLSNYRVGGIPWGSPVVFIPNVLGLGVVYGALWWRHRMHAKNAR